VIDDNGTDTVSANGDQWIGDDGLISCNIHTAVSKVINCMFPAGKVLVNADGSASATGSTTLASWFKLVRFLRISLGLGLNYLN
jgi:hypothetical protein